MDELTTAVTTGTWEFDTGAQYLIRHVRSGTYYVRARGPRGIVRRSLGTDSLTEAKRLLPHILISIREEVVTSEGDLTVAKTWADAERIYLSRSRQDPTASAATYALRDQACKKIRAVWTRLAALQPHEIADSEVRAVFARLANDVGAVWYNSVRAACLAVWDVLAEGRPGIANPFSGVKRLGVKLRELTLPEPEQWENFLQWIDSQGTPAEPASDLIRLLAFAGLRISEGLSVTWGDIDWEKGFLRVQGAKDRRASSTSTVRRVPITPPFQAYFQPRAAGKDASTLIARITDLSHWFSKAHKCIDFPPISHHDLRHLFATRCIESGVDIPTVSRWLGHKDGGALAMRVYGHLRETHSQEAAQKVRF